MKFSLSLITFLLSFSLFAQNQKGNFILGGNLGLSSSYGRSESSATSAEGYNYNIGFNLGYFLSERWLIGNRFNYRFSKSLGIESFTDSYWRSFQASPFFRFYFNKGRFPVFWFGEGDLSLRYYKFGTGNDQKSHSYGFATGFGVNFFIAKDVALELSLGYYYQKRFGQDFVILGNDENLSVNLGVQYFFNRVASKRIENLEEIYFKRGNYNLRASGHFFLDRSTTNSISQISFSPSIQYFLKKHLSIGGGMGLFFRTLAGEVTYQFTSLNTRLTKYFKLKDGVYFSAGIGLYVLREAHSSLTITTGGGGGTFITQKETTISWTKDIFPQIRVHYFLGNRVILSAGLNYRFSHKNRAGEANVLEWNGGWSTNIEYFLTQNISISTTGRFSVNNTKQEDSITNSELLDGGQSTSFNLGFRFFIREK